MHILFVARTVWFSSLTPSTKTQNSSSFWKKQSWNIEQRLLTSSRSHRNCNMGAGITTESYGLYGRAWALKKILVRFFGDFLLPYQLCYSLIHYFKMYILLKVFSIQWYQLYAYPGFWAWVTGSLLWARQSGGNWEK